MHPGECALRVQRLLHVSNYGTGHREHNASKNMNISCDVSLTPLSIWTLPQLQYAFKRETNKSKPRIINQSNSNSIRW